MDFKIKTQEELAGMKAEELAQYHTDFIAAKNAELDAKIESKADSTAIADLRKEIFESLQSQTKQINEALALQVKRAETAEAKDSIKEAVASVKSDIDDYINGKKGNFSFSVKTPTTMTFATSVSGSIIVPYQKPGIDDIRKRNPFMRELVNVISSPANAPIWWTEEVAQDGGAGVTAEGNKKSQVQYKLIGRNSTMTKKTIFGTISKEMLREPFISNFVRTKMLRDLEIYIDTEIITAVTSGATAFAAGSFAGTVVKANIYDVIACAYNQAALNQYAATTVAMNPTDMTKLKLVKDKNENYVVAPFASADGTMIDGMKVIANTGITAGNVLVFDPSLVDLYIGENITFEMGLNADDFTKNLRTMLAESELITVLPNNSKKGIIYANINTAIAAIKKAS